MAEEPTIDTATIQPQGVLPEALGIADPLTRRMRESAEPVMRQRQAQAEKIARAEGALLQDQTKGEAEAAQFAANQERAAYENLQKQKAEKPLPPFVPTQDTAQDLAGLFGMVGVFGSLLGAAGTQSGLGAMNAMTGMLTGYKQGRKDLYDRELSTFKEKLEQMKSERADWEKTYSEARELAKTDLTAALAKVKETAAAKGANVILEKARMGQFDDAMKLIDAQTKLETQIFSKVLEAQAKTGTQKVQPVYVEAPDGTKEQKFVTPQELLGLQSRGYKITPISKSGFGAVQLGQAQRAVNALGGVASAVESLNELPAGTTTGMLPYLGSKEGMLNYVSSTLGRKISSREADQMNTLFTGIGRNLAAIEASGTATGLAGLSNQLQSGVYINSGTDDPYKVALKIADIRRIAEENIRPAITSGLMPPEQRDTAEKLVQRIEKAIPFTTIDVIRAGQKPGAKTIGETSKAAVAGQAAPEMSEEEYNQAEPGTLYRIPGDPTVRRKP